MLQIWVYETCPYPLHMVKCLGKQHESKKISLNIFVNRLSSITKKGEIESPSLVSDNWWNLGLAFDLSVWIRKCGPLQVIEQDEVHGVEDGHEMMMIKLNLEKKKEKNKNREDQGKGIR